MLSATSLYAQAPAPAGRPAHRPSSGAYGRVGHRPFGPRRSGSRSCAGHRPPGTRAVSPAGAKVGFVNLQAIAQLTADGKAAAAKVNALAQKKQTEAADKAKALQTNQQKLQTSGGVMLSDAACDQLEKEIERQQVDGQRYEQDAQAELNELQQQLQQEFQGRLMPVLEALSKEKGLQVLFSAADAGVIWIEPGIDLTLEAVKRMDGGK